MIERNTEGLKKSAKTKRERSFQKLEQGIQKLLKEGTNINFKSVAQASGLSRAWLYKQPEVKERIVQLREQTEVKTKIPAKHKASDASKDALLKTLKIRLKKLEGENKGLKQQLEVVYGQFTYSKEQDKKIERLEAENKKLKEKLYAPVSKDIPEKKVISLKSKPEISQQIRDELDNLGIPPTSTLANKIIRSSEEQVLTAIEALKEQMDLEIVERPGAWLSKAITDGWKPNQAIGGTKPQDTFAQWYDLAKEQGIVKGCRQEPEGWLVKNNTDDWVDYQEFSNKWTLKYLKSRARL